MKLPKTALFALRYCGSCLAILACWVVWLALGALLIMLIYVAVAKELPVPDFVLRKVEARLAEANLSIKFGRAQFDPKGQLLLENVQLRSKQFDDPLLTSRLVFVRRSIWNILAGRPIPDEIRLEGAALQLPAMLSPSGTAEPVLRDVALVLRHEENIWHLDQLAGRIGQIAVTAHGSVCPPPHAVGARPLSPDEIALRFLQVGRRLVLAVHQFDAFDEPAVAIRLDNPEGIGNTATFLFTAKAARQPGQQPLILGPLALGATLRLDGKGERTARLHVAVRDAVYRDKYAAENLRAIISARVQPENVSVRPVEALVAIGALSAENETALAPVLRVDVTGLPQVVRATLATQLNGEFLAATVEANLREQSAHLQAGGRGSPELINRVLNRRVPRAASYFLFGDPVSFTADATFSAGWHFERLFSRVATGRLDSHGVKIDAARGQIDIVGNSFLAHDARVVMGENAAQGSYWMNFGTSDYRMLLTGRLRPAEINGWFRNDWWSRFWNDHFAFPVAPPEGDVDVQGRWRESARSEYFGRAESVGPVVLGATLDHAHTLIFLRPNYTQALALDADRAGGRQRMAGWFKRTADPDRGEMPTWEFNFDSNADTETYRKLAEGKADATLAGLRFNQPPQIHIEGSLQGNGPNLKPRLTFNGQATGGLYFYDFPIESAQVSGGMSGDVFRLDDIQFAVAGGKGTATAVLKGKADARRLSFDARVAGADLVRSIRAVEEFQVNRTGQKSESVAESKFVKRAAGGKLDASLAAEGQPGELASFTGTGKAALTGAELGEVHLFGLLSQVLSGLSLNFSSLKLNAVHTSLKMEAGRLHFPDLRITGPSAVIDARGDFAFGTNALDFTAKFRPYEENRNLLTATIGLMIKPITSMLELKLNGPLSKPVWSVVVGPSEPPPETTPAPPTPVVPVEATPIPPAPAPAK